MARPTTLANGMEILLSASLDQCGLSERQIEAIAEEGYLTVTDFSLNRFSDIDNFAKKLSLPPAKGGVNLGYMQVLRLKALLYWLKNQVKRGVDLYDEREDFGQYELEECIKALEAYEDMDKYKDSKTKAPEKFQPHSLRGWTQFNRDLQNYLASIRGISGVPLSYVIRKEEYSDVAPPDEDAVEQLVRLAPLNGMSYLEDKKRVYRIIRDAVSGTDGWTWMQDVRNEDGRQAMTRLRDHYDGPGAKTRRVQDAKERLKVGGVREITCYWLFRIMRRSDIGCMSSSYTPSTWLACWSTPYLGPRAYFTMLIPASQVKHRPYVGQCRLRWPPVP